MLKKIISIVVIFALSCTGITGCGANSATNKDNTENSSATDTQSTDTQENKDLALNDKSIYEGFLDGSEALYFNKYNPNLFDGYDYEKDEFTKAFKENTPYKITDILRYDAKAVSNGYYDADDEYVECLAGINSVNYAYIDLGRDDIPELALSVNYDSEASYIYIIKDFNGKIECVYRLESVYRSYEDLNTNYGLINSYGSYGYAQGMDDLYYLDGNGELNTVYRSEFSYYPSEYFFGSETEKEFYNAEEEDEIQFYRYIFKDYPEYIDDFYEFYRTNGVYTAGFSEDSQRVKEICNFAKVSYVNMDEIESLIAKRKEEIGCPTDEFSKKDEIDWISLDNKEIEEIISYGFDPVYVDNIGDFIGAVKDNATIVIDSNAYINVSEYLDANINKLREWVYEDDNKGPGVYYRYVNDGLELVIYKINNIRITSSDSEKKASLVCEPRYANVICFETCNMIKLDGLYMGHTPEEAYCSGSVINFNECINNITVNNCELFGCGTYGITAYDSGYIDVYNTIIRDCSYGCVDIYNINLISFDDCTFKDCKEFVMFDLRYADAWFNNCSFKNLNGDMIYLSEDNYASFYGCTFDKDALNSLESYSGPGEVRIN